MSLVVLAGVALFFASNAGAEYIEKPDEDGNFYSTFCGDNESYLFPYTPKGQVTSIKIMFENEFSGYVHLTGMLNNSSWEIAVINVNLITEISFPHIEIFEEWVNNQEDEFAEITGFSGFSISVFPDNDSNLTKECKEIIISITEIEEDPETPPGFDSDQDDSETKITDSENLEISEGWSNLGLINFSINVGLLVNGKEDKIISVWRWKHSYNNWSVYLPGEEDGGESYAESKGFNTLKTLHPGEGFWVNSAQKTSIHVMKVE